MYTKLYIHKDDVPTHRHWSSTSYCEPHDFPDSNLR